MGWIFNGKCKSEARLDGKTAIVTGSNTGIGKVTAKDLAQRGADVILACRNLEKAHEAAREIETVARGKVIVEKLDLSSLQSVREFCDRVLQNHSQINLLINNAGVMSWKREVSVDGYEMQFATNHLGHFLLTLLLLPTIIKSKPARIVNVSSKAHYVSWSLHFDDINLERSFWSFVAYGRSKLANILFTKELAKRLKGTGVNVYSLHPGIVRTELIRNIDKVTFGGFDSTYRFVGRPFMKSPEEGAQTTIYCAVDEKVENESGLYYDDCGTAWCTWTARDENLAQKLWSVSEEMVKLGNFDPFSSLN